MSSKRLTLFASFTLITIALFDQYQTYQFRIEFQTQLKTELKKRDIKKEVLISDYLIKEEGDDYFKLKVRYFVNNKCFIDTLLVNNRELELFNNLHNGKIFLIDYYIPGNNFRLIMKNFSTEYFKGTSI